MNTTSLSLLARIASSDDEHGWSLFLSAYRPLILRYLKRSNIPEMDAEDLCQEVLLKTFRSIHRFEHNGQRGAFRRWLRRLVTQAVWHYHQQATKQVCSLLLASLPNDIEDHIPSELVSDWDREHDSFLIDQILRAVQAEFSSTSWRAFNLLVIERQPASEIATQLNISRNAVYLAKSRIMHRLRCVGKGWLDSLEL